MRERALGINVAAALRLRGGDAVITKGAAFNLNGVF
jgi:hypothetical protein